MSPTLLLCGVIVGVVDALLSQKHTMARHWHEVVSKTTHLSAADPTQHARDFFHFSLTLWETWRLYNSGGSVIGDADVLRDIGAPSFASSERRDATDAALAQAAFAFLSRRYAASRNAAAIAELLAAAMNETGAAADETTIGARVASAIHGWALTDGACEDTKYACRDKVYTTKNPDLMNPLWSGAGALRDPSRWQRLKMGVFTDKSDVTINGYPDFTTPQWGRVRPFAIVRPAGADAYFDPPPPPMWGPDGTSASHAQFVGNHTVVAKCSSWNDPDDGAEWSISPGDHALGANSRFGETIGCDANLSSACANVGVNHQFNPATQKPYAPNRAKRGDYLRVMSEYWERMFWRAGPESDSPTRLWNWLLDRVVLDDAAFDFRWAGASADAPLDRQEFELRSYLLLNAGLHDAAIAVWEVKLKYDSARPVSALRFMASLGQSSNTSADNYHAGALPIIEDLMRIVTPADVCEARCGNYSMAERGFLPGPFFYVGINNIGKMMVRAWRAQTNTGVYGVGWFLGQDWNTFRRPTFVTPPFPGFVSGHSTFARVAADTLVRITGSAFFPGGLYSFTFPADAFFVPDGGIHHDVELQWATYSDAADECSLSRVYCGAHIPADDVPGRRMGRRVAAAAWAKLNSAAAFGVAKGPQSRVAVRVELASADVFATQVDVAAALQEHVHSTLQASAQSQSTALPFHKVQIVGRAHGESALTRTVFVGGALPSNFASQLFDRVRGDSTRFASVELLACDDLLECVTQRRASSSVAATVGIIIAVLLLVVLLAAVVAWLVWNRRRSVTIA
jgi:hypothetical protein